jgi:hypothetical protein
MDYYADLTYTKLYFTYYDNVVVGPRPSYLSIGIRRISDL